MQISSNIRGDNTIVKIDGRLDPARLPARKNNCWPWWTAGARNIVLDCAGLEYVSSAGLRVLLALAKRVGGSQGLRHRLRPPRRCAKFSTSPGSGIFCRYLPPWKRRFDVRRNAASRG